MEVYKILLVEDDKKSGEITSRILEKFNFQVDHVLDARVATAKLKNNYNLILCDVMMPMMDGFTFLEKNRDQIKNIPVIMLTALKEKEDILKAASLKVFQYIVKPFEPELLLQKVSEALKLDRDNLVLKKDIELKIKHQVLGPNSVKLFINGIASYGVFKLKMTEYMDKLLNLEAKIVDINIEIGLEFYYVSDSNRLIEELIEDLTKKFSIKKDSILLKGDYFSKLNAEEKIKSKFSKNIR